MGSHVRRGRSSSRGGSGGGSGGGGSGGGSGAEVGDEERRERPSPRDVKIQDVINEHFFSNNFSSASELAVINTIKDTPKNEYLTLLLTSIDVIQRARTETIVDKDDFISNSLNKALDHTGYKIEEENKELISNIIKNNLQNIGGVD